MWQVMVQIKSDNQFARFRVTAMPIGGLMIIVHQEGLQTAQGKMGIENCLRAYPVQRTPALCGVWERVSVTSLTLACAMRGDRDSNPGPSGHRR